MHDPDDPPPQCGWRPGEYWMVFRLTLPTNLFWLVGYIIAFSFVVPHLARGEDHAHHQACEIGDYGCQHDLYHDWYQTGEAGGPIMRPDEPGYSCCNGDCRPTKIKWIGRDVYAYISRVWTRVPAEKIKEGVTKKDTRAHICATSVIFCLILPEIEN